MRFLIVVCCLLFGALAMPNKQLEDADPYSINMVKFELRMRSGGKRVIHSWNQKRLARLGDATSIALLKILDARDFESPQTVRDILPIIRDSFENPELISSEFDKQPKVTFFLLQQLQRNMSDPQARHDIRQTIEFIGARTASRGEPAQSP